MKYYYSVYNLLIESELLLPNLQTIDKTPDAINPVTISYGTVGKEGLHLPAHQGFAYQATRTEFWLNIPSVARFLVSNGTSITIELTDGVDEESIHAFLLNTCMEVLLRQRQLIVMPGFAFKMGDYGISFLGGSGLGQSMLQGLFYKRGHSFLAGNFITLNDQGDILPGVAQVEFWPLVVSSLKLETFAIKTLRPTIKKWVFPLKQHYYSSPLPLKCIYTLKMHQQPDVVFSKIDEAHKLPYLQQLVAVNNLPIDLWYDTNNILPNPNAFNNIQLICIHLPMIGLKLQQIADSIENDLIERGHYYA